MAMRYAEMVVAIEELDRVEKAVFRDTIQQEEFGEVRLSWQPSWRDGALTYRFFGGDVRLSEATPAAIDRYREIRLALEAWQRNEADWPMARKP